MDNLTQPIKELIAERDALKAQVAELEARVRKLQDNLLRMYEELAAQNNPYREA